jgi:hypothetical protein
MRDRNDNIVAVMLTSGIIVWMVGFGLLPLLVLAATSLPFLEV